MESIPDNELRRRIISRLEKEGYNDPFVVTEMLDRFEGTVVLKMKKAPSLSLEDALNEAMTEGHGDIRLPGKYSVLTYYQDIIKKKYTAVYRNECKKMLTNPVYLIGILLVSLLSFEGYYYAYSYFRIWDMNGMGLMLFFSLLLSTMLLFLKFSISNKTAKIISTIVTKDYLIIYLIFFLLPMHSVNGNRLMFSAILCASGWFYLIITVFAKYTTLEKARKAISLCLSRNSESLTQAPQPSASHS